MYGISNLFPLIFIVFVIFIVVQDPMRLYLFFIKLIKFLLSKNICFLSNLTPQDEKNFHFACLVLNWITIAGTFRFRHPPSKSDENVIYSVFNGA